MSLIQKIKDLIEEARQSRELGGGNEQLANDRARVATVALDLEGHEAMLANRLICQGADPASLDYLDAGDVSEEVQLAHEKGPGVFDPDSYQAKDYLALCALSAEESSYKSVRENFFGFVRAMSVLNMEDEQLRQRIMDAMGKAELAKIRDLPYALAEVGGRPMRVYHSDRGFAAAYWDAEPVACVIAKGKEGPFLMLGAAPSAPSLEEQGVKLDKLVKSHFGLIFNEDVVQGVLRETGTVA